MFTAFRPLLLIFALGLVLPAQAQDTPRDRSSQRESAGDRVREVERDGGRVLQAEPMQRSGREVYRFKVLTPEGRVRVLDDSRRDRSFERSQRPERSEAPEPGQRSERPESRQRPEPRGDDGSGQRPNY